MVVVTRDDVEAEGLVGDLEAWGSLWPTAERPGFLLFPEADQSTRIASLGLWDTRPWAILVGPLSATL